MMIIRLGQREGFRLQRNNQIIGKWFFCNERIAKQEVINMNEREKGNSHWSITKEWSSEQYTEEILEKKVDEIEKEMENLQWKLSNFVLDNINEDEEEIEQSDKEKYELIRECNIFSKKEETYLKKRKMDFNQENSQKKICLDTHIDHYF